MRENRFRAWDKQEKCWLDPKHFYITGEGEPFTCQQGRHNISCRYELMGTTRYIVERFTGLKDKNGVDLDWWDGDIVKDTRPFVPEKDRISQIVFKQGSFWLKSVQGKKCLPIQIMTPYLHRFTRIGNVHDNPKLLETEK